MGDRTLCRRIDLDCFLFAETWVLVIYAKPVIMYINFCIKVLLNIKHNCSLVIDRSWSLQSVASVSELSLRQVDNWAISTPIIPCYLKTYKDKTIPFACFWMNLFLNFPPAPKMIRQIDQFEHNPWPICIWRRCHWQLIENKCWIVILSTHVYVMIDVK